MNVSRSNSKLAQQAEKFLYQDSLHSSDSSIDLHRSLSPDYRSRISSKKNDASQGFVSPGNLNKSTKEDKQKPDQTTRSSHRSRSKRLKSPEASQKLNTTRPKSFGKKNGSKPVGTGDLANPISCQQEKYLLRIKVSDLEGKIDKQSKKVKTLYERVLEKREDVKDLTNQLLESKKKNFVILELKEKIKALENNELGLVQELNEQQKEAKKMLYKLYDMQEEFALDAERSKKEYQEYCNKFVEDQQEQCEAKLRLMEEENQRLRSQIREMHEIGETEMRRRDNEANKEIITLRSELKDKVVESQRAKDEILMLRESIKETEKMSMREVRSLQNSVELLSDQNRALRFNEDEVFSRDLYEKNLLKGKIDALQGELLQKDRLIKEKDMAHREQVESLNQKIMGLQGELKRNGEYNERVDKLEKDLMIKENELVLSKRYYEEALEGRKALQEQQKKEWSSLYNELLGEIRILKGEMDSLGDSKRLMSTLKFKERLEH